MQQQGFLSSLMRVLDVKQIDARIAELEQRHDLTVLEKVELLLLKKGEKQLPRAKRSILHNEDISSVFGYTRRLSQDAHKAGYYLEAMTLDLLLIKYLLQVQLMKVSDVAEVFDEKSDFNRMLSKAEKAGLDRSLMERLQTFYDNCMENKSHLFTGDIRYEELRRVFKQDPKLLNDLFEFLNPP